MNVTRFNAYSVKSTKNILDEFKKDIAYFTSDYVVAHGGCSQSANEIFVDKI